MNDDKTPEHILIVERELNRISKISKFEYYNPVLVLNLSKVFENGINRSTIISLMIFKLGLKLSVISISSLIS